MDLAETNEQTTDNSPQHVPEGEGQARVMRSDEIFQGGREVRIEHEESVYRLRLTRKGKLILHK